MVKKPTVKTRRWTLADIPAIKECQLASYQDYPIADLCDERLLTFQFNAFPEGQFLAEIGGKVVGYATSIIIQLDDDTEGYTYGEITGVGTFSTHNYSGDSLYGADIAVHPEYRGRGIAEKLYGQRRKLLKKCNLLRMIAYGRIPGFSEYVGKITPEEYVDQVKLGTIKDSALNAHLKAGYEVKRILLDFMRDQASMNYSTFLELLNPQFCPERRKIAAAPLKSPVRKIRVCAGQYQMRMIKDWDEFRHTVEFFTMAADEYHCHFLLLPELFTAQLFVTMPTETDPLTAINNLAELTGRYIEMFCELAQKSNLYIIAGSQPTKRAGKIYNTAYLFTPTGKYYTQDKLHITPGERRYWNIHPGEEICVFQTPFGRIAIQICYDIEFPEVSRLLTLAGVETIFVPFSTDEKKSYHRVRFTAQARAVENYIYVVTSGNVGNLPTIEEYLINYGQAAVFTPSDFAFPPDAIAGESEPNVETVVIADLDLMTLAQQRESGSVRPLYDRRPDLYHLSAKIPLKLIQTE